MSARDLGFERRVKRLVRRRVRESPALRAERKRLGRRASQIPAWFGSLLTVGFFAALPGWVSDDPGGLREASAFAVLSATFFVAALLRARLFDDTVAYHLAHFPKTARVAFGELCWPGTLWRFTILCFLFGSLAARLDPLQRHLATLLPIATLQAGVAVAGGLLLLRVRLQGPYGRLGLASLGLAVAVVVLTQRGHAEAAGVLTAPLVLLPAGQLASYVAELVGGGRPSVAWLVPSAALLASLPFLARRLRDVYVAWVEPVEASEPDPIAESGQTSREDADGVGDAATPSLARVLLRHEWARLDEPIDGASSGASVRRLVPPRQRLVHTLVSPAPASLAWVGLWWGLSLASLLGRSPALFFTFQIASLLAAVPFLRQGLSPVTIGVNQRAPLHGIFPIPVREIVAVSLLDTTVRLLAFAPALVVAGLAFSFATRTAAGACLLFAGKLVAVLLVLQPALIGALLRAGGRGEGGLLRLVGRLAVAVPVVLSIVGCTLAVFFLPSVLDAALALLVLALLSVGVLVGLVRSFESWRLDLVTPINPG